MSGFRAAQPHGKTADFADAVAAKYGVAFANAWLGPKTCRFTDTTVFTIGIARDRLAAQCDDLIAKHGVTIAVCPDVTAGFYREVDAR